MDYIDVIFVTNLIQVIKAYGITTRNFIIINVKNCQKLSKIVKRLSKFI